MSGGQQTTQASVQETVESSDIETKSGEAEPEDKYLIRECDTYKDEYDECTSFKGRFHQYFIFGESLDCNQWKRDYQNCCRWENKKDVKAAEALIRSEKARRLERLRAHIRNDIWKKRENPPADWEKPLPDWMVKRDENTYLAKKAQELRDGAVEESPGGFCSIM